MTGVVLAGGEGTRLRPLTHVANKHLLPVYDKPMIYYPIETLKQMGCDEIILVTGGNNIGGFASLLKDGEELGVDITYKVQSEAGGIAQALGCVAGLRGLFPVILGDNYFSESPEMPVIPTIYTKSVNDPERFGVYADGGIIEKPSLPASNQAVVGLYVYDERVFDMIANLEPSARGEYEITDVNNQYLKLGAEVVELSGYWSDMGTFDSLLEVANYVRP
jgi:glucose-1-phosphate thymidylyltransferase